MDLPTCPTCGQSVLDDDASECPFCGAAMDGSSGAKKKASATAAAPKKKEAPPKKQEPDNDDPFAIAQSSAAKKVIPCSRKPGKGRLQRVVCPMCDEQGFIPKRALGQQVKCPNPKCLVPVFTAIDGDKKKEKPRAPARVADEERARAAADEQQGAGKNNSLMVYGIGGAVLLAATLGLVFYLNSNTGPDELPPVKIPIVNTEPDDDDPPEDDPPNQPSDNQTDPQPTVDYQQEAVALVDRMITAALSSDEHRDRAFSRRLTGDAWLRLGMDEKADEEFQQMRFIASQDRRDLNYYEIAPRIGSYWRAIAGSDQAAADAALTRAKEESEKLPNSGLVALESSIALAAALVNSGDIDAAKALLEPRKGDISVDTEQDTIRHAAWASCSELLRDHSEFPLHPLRAFAWEDPLATAVALHLAVNHRWQQAAAWIQQISNPQVASDALAVVARRMSGTSAADQEVIAAAARAAGPQVELRALSALCSVSDQWLEQANAAFAQLPEHEPETLGSVIEIINARSPDISPSMVTATAIAEYVSAVHRAGQDTTLVFEKLNRVVFSAVPPTAAVRKTTNRIVRESSDVKDEVAAALQLSDSREISSRFNVYRRGVDRIARVAESRRRAVLYLCAGMIDSRATEPLVTALKRKDLGLRQEVFIDNLFGLLLAATPKELTLPADSGLHIPIARVDPIPEAAVVRQLVEAWQTLQNGQLPQAAAQLEKAPRLTGLRAAFINYMVEQFVVNSRTVEEQVEAVRRVRDDRWQEHALHVIGRVAARSDQLKKGRSAIMGTPPDKATARVVFIHGLLCGTVEMLDQAED